MPSETPREHRAMEAAAEGKSKIGIPKKVGQEFVKADDRKAMAMALRSKKKAKASEPPHYPGAEGRDHEDGCY